MLPFLSLHALAAQSGDGLRPELLALFARRAGSQTGLSARIDTLRSPREFFDRQQHALGQVTKELKANQNASLSALLASRDAAAALP
jgi:hypothetical protein